MNISIKVSIAVFSYNQEKYIRQTLDSIIAQEHPYSWELIVCDDASQDTTPEIISEYAGKHPEIVPVLRRENLGLIKNFFDGISRCRGEYVMVCAGDDYWLPGKVAKQVEFMDTHPETGLCYGDALRINEIGDIIDISYSGIENTSFVKLLRSNCVPACSICMKKELYERYVLEVSPLMQSWLMEDYPMLLWYAANSHISYLKGECATYRILSNSASHFDNMRSNQLLVFKKSIFDVKTYYIEMYPELALKIRHDISFEYIKELIIMRTLSYQDWKYEINKILKQTPYLKRGIRVCFYLVNNYNLCNLIFLKTYNLFFQFLGDKVKKIICHFIN